MAVVNLKGSRIITGLTAEPPVLADPGEGGGRLKVWVETVETTASDSVSSTYHMARLPSNARILGTSRIWWDDLATAGSPTIDIGVYPIRTGDFTGDDDALNDGLAVATANTTGVAVVKDMANYGKRVWEFINGQTADPKCDVDVKLVIRDAALTAAGAGTITMEIHYAVD
jgi:hypothetical protein